MKRLGLSTVAAVTTLVATLAGLAGAGVSVYTRAALADTNQKLALLEKQDATLGEHDTALGEALKTEQAYRKSVLAKLDALCRATPRANCPLGENDR